MAPKKKRPWRYWNNLLHRDVGYFLVGLTVIYAVSGLAVNHLEDWNPSYSFERQEYRFEPFEPSDRETVVRTVLDRLGLPEPIDAFRKAPGQVELLYDGWSVEANVELGTAVSLRPRGRPVLKEFNLLHLNKVKGAWTWIADAYAVLLTFMAISGMLVLRGKKGLGGRGKWFVTAGILFPLAYLLVIGQLG